MIQRIQTVYFFLAALVISLMFFFPLAEFRAEGQTIMFLTAFSVEYTDGTTALNQVQTYPLAVLIAAILFTTVIALFLFKRRKLQLRLTIYDFIFQLGSVFMIYFYSSAIADHTQTDIQYAWPATLPVIAMVLTMMARRGVAKDEKKIRSLDRIR